MSINDKGKDSQCKRKVIICPKCGRKGRYTIDCPNESDCLICGGNGHYMAKCPTKLACKGIHHIKKADLG